MADDTEFTKLPIEECCSHKLWKARVHGYTEAAKLFGQADDEKAPIFNQYLGLVSKMVSDSNAAAQEKGLEAVLLFVQNASVSGKVVKDVMSTIVTKCIGAPKIKTKDLSVQIALMYIETEKHEIVQEELLKGMQQKNPKTVAACISATTLSLKEFGPKVIDIKPLIKIFPTLLEDRDKNVRDEAKNLIVEIYRWIGDALKPKLSTLKPVQITELESEFEKVKSGKPVPSRYLRSQQVQQAKMAAAGGEVEESQAEDGEAGTTCDVDPYELLEPLNVLSKLPQDFYKNIEAKKWQERKEAVEALEKVLDFPKFEKGDYGDLVRALMKIVTKDSNVVVVGFAVKCIARLAGGLKRNFQTYSGFVLPSLLEKFKEKKANVVQPLRDAVDATFAATTFEAIQEDVLSSLDNKNPSVKSETASFLARCFSKSTPATLNKKIIKIFTTALLKTLNESDPTVRDASAEALGTAMKVVGEKVIMPFMTDLDNLKLTKIKECCEKAVVVKPVQSPRPAPAAPKEKETSKTVVKKVVTGGARKSVTPPVVKPKTNDKEMSQEEVDEKANEVFSEEVVKGLSDGTWKTRLESVESFTTTIQIIDSKEIPSQVLVKTLTKKPGLKDTNVQVLKAKLEALKFISENFQMSSIIVESILQDIVDKLGDSKNGTLVADNLTALSESTSLELVGKNVIDIAFQQKNPKVQQEALNWLSGAIKEFGCVIDISFVIENVKKGLNATNASVRTSAVNLCAVLHMYVGQQLMMLFSNEKPAVITLITTEIEKHAGESPPTPIRGSKKGSVESFDEGDDEKEVEKTPQEQLSDIIPRVDISPKITDELIAELGDKNWKVRNEALTTFASILKDAKCIKSNLGELPPVLAQRLVDSNGKLAVLALDICKNLATAMGPSCKIHIKTFFRGFLSALGDNKQWVRQSALSCINTWGTEGGYKEFFEGEIISDAFKTGSPALRTELWNLLSEILPNQKEKSVNKDELFLCLPHLFTNLEDRNSDVRKSAQGAVLGMMIHLGYPAMVKQAEKLKPGSKTVIIGILDKTRPDLPTKPEIKTVKVKKDEPVKAEARSSKTKVVAVKPTVRKKEEEIDLTPILSVNNLKQQRIIDEQRLKILKWNFTLPRSEFVELLKEQMTNAKLNKTLIANMFHADFKYHLKAIDSLNEELSNTEAIVSNLDLILKWMTLRFFDTNPSVLLKGLEYLQNVFNSLIETEYTMFDTEANSFIPYLVLKIGDPKDAVRDRVKGILKQISVMYSSSKLFLLIMEGLKSKNARQRTECLDELGNLIEQFGLSVCQPTPSAALKEIAKQISDRDNSVRNGALNAIVKAWYLEGDKVYKMIGSISEKDSSLLGERIRRAAKNKPNNSISPKQDIRPKPEVVEDEIIEEEEIPEEKVTTVLNTTIVKEEKPEQQFQKMNLIEIDDTFLNSPVQIPEYISSKYNKRETNNFPVTSPADTLNTMFQDLSSNNINIAYNAASRLRFVLESPEVNMDEYVNQILASLVIQLNYVNSYSLDTYGLILPQTYRMLLRIIDDIFFNKTTSGDLASVENLQGLMYELLYGLVEERTVKFIEGGYGKILQVYLSRMIENSNFTNVTCAIIKIIHNTVANPPKNPRFTDVSTKCLCKVISIIKKNSSNIENNLNLDKTLYECHLFFQAFPQHTWTDRPSNLPLKAIKTLLLFLVQLKGKDIFSHVTLIENPCAAEVCLYLKKLIKSKPELMGSKTTSTRLTKEMSEHLSEVFMKIACDGTAKEGLMQFYEFKKKNPNIDLTPYLAPTSKYFQDYVENGLKEIEREMANGGTGENVSLPSTSSMQSLVEDSAHVDDHNLAQYYLEKLKLHYKRTGLPPPEYPDFEQK